jgi:hypothetical protein
LPCRTAGVLQDDLQAKHRGSKSVLVMTDTLLLLLTRGTAADALPDLMRTYRTGGADTVVLAQQSDEPSDAFMRRVARRALSLARDGRRICACVHCPSAPHHGDARGGWTPTPSRVGPWQFLAPPDSVESDLAAQAAE